MRLPGYVDPFACAHSVATRGKASTTLPTQHQGDPAPPGNTANTANTANNAASLCGTSQPRGCTVGKLFATMVAMFICFKLAKLAACVLGFFLGWIVIPAGGAVIGLGFAVVYRLLSTVCYSVLLYLAVWRFTWLASGCYKVGKSFQNHFEKRHDYVAAARLWLLFKQTKWQAFRSAQQQQWQQQRGQRQRQQQPQQRQQQQISDVTAATATTAAATTTTKQTDFLEFASAMSDAMAKYERANGLATGTANTFILEQQQQQQQQQQQERLYPQLDAHNTVTV